MTDLEVVYRRENSWFTGTIKDDKLRKKKDIKKLSDATSTNDYLTVKQWVSLNDGSMKVDDLFKKFKIDSLYVREVGVVMDSPSTMKEIKQAEKDWWATLNEKCVGCSKKCKQSSKVEVLKCKCTPIKGK
jgi:hypothetical protein